MFTTVTLSSLDDIHAYSSRRGWLYRGERTVGWQPKTSLERCCDRLDVKPKMRRTIEGRIIREFRRAYHQFAARVPDRELIVEWLSIMQHHGAPTRLLDFTYSVHVAAYFAVEEAEGDSVVWALDGPWALQRAAALLKSAGKKQTASMLKPFMDNDEILAESLFMKKPYVSAVWPINPFRLNERLRVQQGAFLLQGDISKSFLDNLTALSPTPTDRIVRIVIPESLRIPALRQLWSMDISRAALFPGLDGFAKSLGVNHSLFNPAPWADPSVTKRRWVN
jgi:FRG domain-containing protein